MEYTLFYNSCTTYVLAVAKDKRITLSSAEDLKTSVVEVIDLILRCYDMNSEAFLTDGNQLRKELVEFMDESEEEETSYVYSDYPWDALLKSVD